jgi:hypothetical protein
MSLCKGKLRTVAGTPRRDPELAAKTLLEAVAPKLAVAVPDQLRLSPSLSLEPSRESAGAVLPIAPTTVSRRNRPLSRKRPASARLLVLEVSSEHAGCLDEPERLDEPTPSAAPESLTGVVTTDGATRTSDQARWL